MPFSLYLAVSLIASPEPARQDVEALSRTIEQSYRQKKATKDPHEERKLYSEALRSIGAESWDEALLRMEHFVRYYPDSDLADNAIFWMAQIYLRKQERRLALAELNRLIRDYPSSERNEKAVALISEISTALDSTSSKGKD